MKRLTRIASIITFVAALVIASLGLTDLGTIPLLIILITLMLAPIFYGLVVWIKVFNAQDIAAH